MAEPPKYKSSSLPRARGGGRSSRLMHCRSCRRYAEASDAAKNQTGHLVYLVTKWGRPHSVNAFAIGSSGGAARRGLQELSAHGLRKLGAQRCAEAGASEHEMKALFWPDQPEASRNLHQKANRAGPKVKAGPLLQRQNGNTSDPDTESALLLEAQTSNENVPFQSIFQRWCPESDSNQRPTACEVVVRIQLVTAMAASFPENLGRKACFSSSLSNVIGLVMAPE